MREYKILYYIFALWRHGRLNSGARLKALIAGVHDSSVFLGINREIPRSVDEIRGIEDVFPRIEKRFLELMGCRRVCGKGFRCLKQ